MEKADGIADARIKIDHIHWYIPHYGRSIQQQCFLSKQNSIRTHTELRYIERSVFMKEVKSQNLWISESGTQDRVNIPTWVIIGFQKRDRQDSQNLNNDTFCRLPATCAHCIIGTENHLVAGIFINCEDDDFSRGYGQSNEAFRALTKDDILQAHISHHDFRSSNVRADDVGYNFYVFDIRYQQNFTASQPIRVELNFDGVVPYDINDHALVLTNKIVSVSSGEQRHFDSI